MNTNTLRCAILAALLCGGASHAASERSLALISDLHVGAGKYPNGKWRETEDFRWQADFDAFLDAIAAAGNNGTDLVLTGDVFELWQSPTMTCSTDPAGPKCVATDCLDADKDLGCSEPEAVARLDYTLKQHADFVAAIGRFAAKGSNRVYFVPGNHDAALLLPAVRKLLLDQFKGARVSVAANGYWLSEDGRVYSDHGHQFDEVNKLKGWPTPYVNRRNGRFLHKTWGENMVQQFYNQYEVIFPIIDNLSNEKDGVGYAVQQAGVANSALAVGKFLKFILLQESMRQASKGLGKESGVRRWDVGAVRALPVAFFVEVLKEDEAMRTSVQRAMAGGGEAFEAASLTEEEIDTLCTAKSYLADVSQCPVAPGDLGALMAAGKDRDQAKRDYLRTVLPLVRPAGKSYASVYVSGHTHSAVPPRLLNLGDLANGNVAVDDVNTGAFQRVASAAQIEAIIAADSSKPRLALSLQPEDLPACYNYVWIAPYKNKPSPKLLRWSQEKGGLFTSSEGTCVPPT